MITVEELYNKVTSDKDMMQEFVNASGKDSLSAFAKAHDCDATDKEIREYFMSKSEKRYEGPISDDDLENVSGGVFDFFSFISNFFTSIFGGKVQTADKTDTPPVNNNLNNGNDNQSGKPKIILDTNTYLV